LTSEVDWLCDTHLIQQNLLILCRTRKSATSLIISSDIKMYTVQDATKPQTPHSGT